MIKRSIRTMYVESTVLFGMPTPSTIPAHPDATERSASDTAIVAEILSCARWAPSGDNTQPWRFELIDGSHAVVHGFDTREHCIYDLDGRPSQMSIGAMLETASIAAAERGLRMQVRRRAAMPATRPTFDLHFEADTAVPRDPLAAVIESRSVQRRPFSTLPLTDDQKLALQSSVAATHEVRWIEGPRLRLAMATLLFRSARLRLITPEAYKVHREVIEWNADHSIDRVPDRALGINQATINLMRFAMHSWDRVQFFNRFLAGTWMPRIQMDFIPAWACGAHFVLLARRPPLAIDDNIEAGRALQRFWLTASHLGLMLQPELTPLIFARYARDGRAFSTVPGTSEAARRVADDMQQLMGADAVTHGVFMGRLGRADAPRARSTRKDLAALWHEPADRA